MFARANRASRWKVRVLIVMAAVLFAALAPAGSAASADAPSSVPDERIRQFLEASERLYGAVGGPPELVLKELREVETALRSLPMVEIATAEGIEALADSVVRMRMAVVAISPDLNKWKAGAAEIRLAADALAHPGKPLWHRYKRLMLEDADELERAVRSSDRRPQAAVTALDRLQSRYALVRTSALLQGEPAAIERADAVLRYAERVVKGDRYNKELAQQLGGPIKDALNGVFAHADAAAGALPMAGPSWSWTAAMGAFIVTTLAWVGWRRYRYEHRG